MSELIILMNHNGKQPHPPATSKCKFNQHLQFDCFKTIKLKKLSFVGGKFFPIMRRNKSSLFSMVHGKKMSSWKILN